MANFSGSALFGFLLFPSASVALPTTGLVVGRWSKSLDRVVGAAGDLENMLPAERLSATFPGEISFSYFDDFYNRVWFVPSAVDFGPIVSDSEASVYLWNANLKSVTLSSIADDDENDRVTVRGLAAGQTVPPLAGLTFQLAVSGDGEPSLSYTFGFTFSSGEYLSLPVVGIRSRLWPFSPNWSGGYSMTLEYRSDVIVSYEGYEQRRALRDTPRKTVSFTSLMTGDTFRQFLRHMNSWHERSTMMPEFSRPSLLKGDVTAGATFLPVERTQWINPGDIITLHSGRPTGNRTTVRTVESVSDTGITLTTPIDQDWPVRSRIYPTLTGRMADRIGTTMHSNNISSVNVEFSANPGLENGIAVGEPSLKHLNREVLLRRPNWGSGVTPDFTAVIESIDYSVGRITHENPVPFNTRYHKAEFLGMKAADVTDIENFFRRQRGQVGEFFMPTFTEDLVAKVSVDAGTSVLRLSGLEVLKDYRADLTYRDLIVIKNDGSSEMKHVSSIYEVNDILGNDTVIEFTASWSSSFTLAQVKMICWLPLWRFASDSLTISWVTSQVAQVAVTMKSLPYEDAS